MLFSRLSLGLVALAGVVAGASKKEEDAKKEAAKYFHEPGRTSLLAHYDRRYFKNIVDDDTRLDTLSHMVRAWLETTRNKGIETWIAHGTLLGWWWNGQLLPWDWDLDVQMHVETLLMLGQKYNQTKHPYKSADGTVEREYFLDINPWIWQRVRGDGMNIIDARWIDTRNGLFIDITGIAETDPKNPGVLNCKNYHRYRYEDIWPLSDTNYEGVPAKIPYSFDAILEKEYKSSALVVTEYHGHRWNVVSKSWEPSPDMLSGKKSKKLHGQKKYSTVETGGFFYNIYRLVHWWE